MQGVFITGTDTGVGKTHIAVALAGALHRNGIKVIPRKPIESGCEFVDGELVPADAQALMQAAHYEGKLSEVCPYRFEPPISPVRAAHLASNVLTTEQLVKYCLEGSEDGFFLIEGAGGFYSPLAEDGLNADLATSLQLPVLLVARDVLGTLNQVLLSVEAIQMRGLQLVGVVLNQIEDNHDKRMDNAADLRRLIDVPVFQFEHDDSGECELPDGLIERLQDTDDHWRTAHIV